jgi:PAS domain S-box-containing protein
MKRNAIVTKEKNSTPLYFFIVAIVLIFVAEAFVMLLLSTMPAFSLYKEAILDSLLLSIVIVPMLYMLLFRPMVLHIKERNLAEKELQKSHEVLEMRVEERTKELSSEVVERKQAENALQKSEANFIKAQEVAHIGSWYLDLLENSLVWSDENYKIFGVPKGTPMTHERLLIDNEVKWIRRRAELSFDNNGLPISAVGTTQDITKRKMAEEELIKSEARLKEAQKVAHLGNWELGLVDNALWWSDEVYRMFEIDSEEFGASYDAFLNAIHPDDRELVNKAYTDSLKNRTNYSIEHRLLMHDGSVKHVEERCQTDYTDDGTPLRSIGTVLDITERKKVEEALKTNYNQQSALNSVLEIAQQNIPLEEQLTNILDALLTNTWVQVQKRGAIFIVDKDSGTLTLRVQKGFCNEIQNSCASVPFGKCLCGRAAETGEIVFSDSLDHRHEISYDGINQHGHYCVPIKIEQKVLGIVN